MSYPSSIGFWLKGNNIIRITKHIDYILENLDKFGFTKDEIIKRYKQAGEKVGSEGKVRNECIKKTSKQGGIRVRKHSVKRGELNLDTQSQ